MDRQIAIQNLCLHRFWNSLGDGLLKVFVPVLIYQQTGSLNACIAFLLSYYCLQSLLNLSLYERICRWPIVALLLRLIPVLGTQALLTSGWQDWRLMAGLALTTAAANAFYWVPLHFAFVKAPTSKIGRAVSRFRVAAIVGGTIAPVLSGVLLTRVGIGVVASIAVGIYLVSIASLYLPGFGDRQELERVESVPVREEPQQLQPAASFSTFLYSYGLTGIWDTAEVFWALYIFQNSLGLIEVGIAASAIKLGVVVSNLAIGRLTDLKRWWRPAAIALSIYGLLWLGRAVTYSPIWIFSLSAGAGLVRPLFEVPMFSGFMSRAKASADFRRWITLREVAIKMGGTCLVTATVLLPALSQLPFLCASATTLLFWKPLARVAKQKFR
ncbi:MAG: MFS transporter [Synechococcus sp.]